MIDSGFARDVMLIALALVLALVIRIGIQALREPPPARTRYRTGARRGGGQLNLRFYRPTGPYRQVTRSWYSPALAQYKAEHPDPK